MDASSDDPLSDPVGFFDRFAARIFAESVVTLPRNMCPGVRTSLMDVIYEEALRGREILRRIYLGFYSDLQLPDDWGLHSLGAMPGSTENPKETGHGA